MRRPTWVPPPHPCSARPRWLRRNTGGAPRPGTDYRYSFAWVNQQIGSSTIVWHNGDDGGTSTFLGLLPDEQLGVVLLVGGDADPAKNQAGLTVMALLLGRDLPPFSPRFHPRQGCRLGIGRRHPGRRRAAGLARPQRPADQAVRPSTDAALAAQCARGAPGCAGGGRVVVCGPTRADADAARDSWTARHLAGGCVHRQRPAACRHQPVGGVRGRGAVPRGAQSR
jgi:hypothetical protein